MKLSLLTEAGVLDYTGNARTYASPNPIPTGSINQINNLNKGQSTNPRNRLKQHVKECPQCSKGKLCPISKDLMGCC